MMPNSSVWTISSPHTNFDDVKECLDVSMRNIRWPGAIYGIKNPCTVYASNPTKIFKRWTLVLMKRSALK